MGSSYLKNHLGYGLTDEQFADIPHPKLELYTHVTMKTTQAGALLGSIIGPIAAFARPPTRNLPGIAEKAARFGRNGMIIGLALGPFFTYMKAKSFKSVDDYADRDFRLRHNQGQVRVDRGAAAGAAVGTVIAKAVGQPLMLGCVLGISAGIIDMAIYNNMQKKK